MGDTMGSLATAAAFIPGPYGMAARVATSPAGRGALTALLVLAVGLVAGAFVLLLVNVPPRGMLPYSLSTEDAKVTLLTFDVILERFVTEHGAAMEAWWTSEADAADRGAALAAWAARGREAGVHTATFRGINGGRPVCGPGQSPSKPICPAGAGAGQADGTSACDTYCKDFASEPVGSFYVYRDMPPLDLVVSCKRAGADAARGAVAFVPGAGAPDAPSLSTATLLADVELWRDREAFDPLRAPLAAADLPKLRALENVDLFLEALPLYVGALKRENALFRYVDLEDAEETLAELRVAGAASSNCGVLGVRLELAREPRGARYEDVVGIVAAVDGAFAARLAAAVRADRGAMRELEWTEVAKDKDDAWFLEGLASRHPVSRAWRSQPACEAAALWVGVRHRARAALVSGDAAAAADFFAKDGGAGLERAAALAELAGRNSGAAPAAGWLDPARALWQTMMDCLCPDAEGMRLVARCLADGDLSLRAACAGGAAAATGESAVSAKYTSFLNAINAANYARYYVRPARDMLNRLHVSPAMQASFWCAYFSDIAAAYLTKTTRKPHLSELGNVYDTVSVAEYTTAFWVFKGPDGLKARTLKYMDAELKKSLMECSRSYAYANRVISDEMDGDISPPPVPAGALVLRAPGGAALRWPDKLGDELALAPLAEGDPRFWFVMRTANSQAAAAAGPLASAAPMKAQLVSHDGRRQVLYRRMAFVSARRDPDRLRFSPDTTMDVAVSGAEGAYTSKRYTIVKTDVANVATTRKLFATLGGGPLAGAPVCPTPGLYWATGSTPGARSLVALSFSAPGMQPKDVDYASTDQEPPALALVRDGRFLAAPARAGPAGWTSRASGAAPLRLAPLPGGGGTAAFTDHGAAYWLDPGWSWRQLPPDARTALTSGRGAAGVTGLKLEPAIAS